MISSAVIIPEAPRETTPPPNPFKRKLSQSPSREPKRPRVDVDELQYDEPPSRPTPPSEQVRSAVNVSTNVPSSTSPPRRKSSLLTGGNATEEKKRNKRLFGSLLGTLSQTTTKPAHRKRDEIEARQRERMRQQTEEEEERRNQRKRELDRRRREEQKLWDEEAMRQRHQNMRDMAGFLRTKTEPRLYYKPWELRPEEEEEIEHQKKDVERSIQRELGQDDEMVDDSVVLRQHEIDAPSEQQDPTDKARKNGQHSEQDGDAGQEKNHANGHGHDDTLQTEIQPSPVPATDDNQDSKVEESTLNDDDPQQHVQPTQEVDLQKEEDQHGEELVEGQEDDVIY